MEYKVNDKVVHKNGGVFFIESTKKMTVGEEDKTYFCLKPVFMDAQRSNLTIYVPRDKSNEILRPILSKEQATELLKWLKYIEPRWYKDLKTRRDKFSALLMNGSTEDMCIVLKSLYVQQKNITEDSKGLHLMDYDYFMKIKCNIVEELALSLNLTKEEVEKVIDDNMML